MYGAKRLSVIMLATVLLFVLGTAGVAAASKKDRITSKDGLWTALGKKPSSALQALGEENELVISQAYRVNKRKLKRRLKRAPMEGTKAALEKKVMMTIPMPDGSFTRISFENSPILTGNLKRRYRRIRTLKGEGIKDSSITARLDRTAHGFHAQLITLQGTVLVDPLPGKKRKKYISYWKQDLPAPSFSCASGETAPGELSMAQNVSALASGDQLRVYDLAVTATGDYTQHFGSTTAAADRIITTVNRVTGIYEREVAVRFELLAPNVYEDPAGDPFPTGDVVDNALLDQNQSELDAVFGVDGYDIGHVFTRSDDGGGLASFEAACQPNIKARGGSSLAAPEGDAFDVDIVSHQIGHQLGARHTFNGTSGECGGTMREEATAYEPGSGSTIMAFTGKCDPENVQLSSDDYFHTISYQEITDFLLDLSGGGACGDSIATDNAIPTVVAGPDYTIPTGTPFVLTAAGDDADEGDALTYAWEQFDLGDPSPPANDVNGPLFRSLPPVTEPTRTFPAMADILSGTVSPWGTLPTVNRTLNFRVTVRDNRTDGGGVNYDEMVVTVEGDPFAITTPLAGDMLECGDENLLAWDVGGGSDAANVRALLSVDGGQSFDELLAATPNDGSEVVSLPPALLTDEGEADGRIMLEALENIFFDVSDGFHIVDTTPPMITAPDDVTTECTSPDGTLVELGSPEVSDICDLVVDYWNDAPEDGLFQLGVTQVTWTAGDDSGNTAEDFQMVTIEDTTPPELELSLSSETLWAPNHKLLTITAEITTSDICDAGPMVRLVSITSSEPDNSNGDGNTKEDIQGADFGTDDRQFQIRAERKGNGSGRIYTVTYEAVDESGNSTQKVAEVFVPHDQGSLASSE